MQSWLTLMSVECLRRPSFVSSNVSLSSPPSGSSQVMCKTTLFGVFSITLPTCSPERMPNRSRRKHAGSPDRGYFSWIEIRIFAEVTTCTACRNPHRNVLVVHKKRKISEVRCGAVSYF